MAAYTTNPTQTKPRKSGGCGCKCKEEPEKTCSCCQNICFERPQYHCGHLLSSEDLTLQLRYDIEKNKLRNRALFGCGVVCGLRLTCDPNCDGAIRVSKGYAIDGCGNDLVVCESERFNVLARLREKKLLDCPPPPQDPCEEQKPEPDDCPEKRCFYVVACYHEEEDVFETPFQAGCDPKPAACVPTRIHERVCFDVVTKPPSCGCTKRKKIDRQSPPLRRLEEGPVGEYMQAKLPSLKGLFAANQGAPDDSCEVLCNLKKLFRQHLREHPAEFTCDLICELDAIECPKKDDNFAQNMSDAMSALLNLIHQYSREAALGNLVFDCCEPCEPDCIVLGAVYIENGKLRRVCNTPRQYVWTFTNFTKILHFEMMQRALSEMSTLGNAGREPSCCPEFKFEGRLLMERVAWSRYAMSESAQTFPDALDAFIQATSQSFNFADAANFAAGKFDPAMLRELGFAIRDEGELQPSQQAFIERDPTAAFMQHAMVRTGDDVVMFTIPNDPDKKVFAVRDVAAALGAVAAQSGSVIKDLNDRLAASEQDIKDLKASLANAGSKKGGQK